MISHQMNSMVLNRLQSQPLRLMFGATYVNKTLIEAHGHSTEPKVTPRE